MNQCKECGRIFAMSIKQDPAERYYWDWTKKKWITIKHKSKKLKCSGCGAKIKTSRRKTVSLKEEKERLKKKVNAQQHIDRRRPRGKKNGN